MVEDKTLLERWGGALPRYTSYPTAVQFHAGIDETTVAGWLGELPDDSVLSLYLHVPFCEQLCRYCGCHTTAVRSHTPVETYAADLIAEIEAMVARIGAGRPVSRIHWGGGTPTILGPDLFRQVHAVIARAFSFTPDHESAAEADPRLLPEPMVAALAESGIRRVSLGAQDFDPRVQRAIGRVQPYDVVAAAVTRLRAHGILHLNLDLMFGLPLQTEETVARNARLALSLAPDRIAQFGYAHVPWMKRHQRLIHEADLPDPVARIRQYRLAGSILQDGGLRPIGLDHFARPGDALLAAAESGRMRRNFQGYTEDPASVLLGFGASSISALPQGIAQNLPLVPDWRARVRAGRLAVARGLAPDAEDRLRGALIERVMCDMALDIEAVAARFGEAPARFAGLLPGLDAMAADGLLARDGWRIAVAEAGRPFLRRIAALFDRHLPAPGAGGNRHAQAV